MFDPTGRRCSNWTLCSATYPAARRRQPIALDDDHDYRWTLQRVWIAIGNEALAFAEARGLDPRRVGPWARLYLQRNVLAHRRLPDIDDDRVCRHTTLRTDQDQAIVRATLIDTRGRNRSESAEVDLR